MLSNFIMPLQSDIECQLADFNRLQNEKVKFKNSFIFVNTRFTRSSQPIFALAVCESQRRLSLYNKEELFFKRRSELLDELSKIIIEHYDKNRGHLGFWGKIYDYHVHLFDEITSYNVDGSISNINRPIASV